MNIYIIHDSEKGNGKALAEALSAKLESLGARVVVGHRTDITPKQVADGKPDLLIIGAAVRKFFTSPPVKQWISRLSTELKNEKTNIPRAATFLTHVMTDAMVTGRAERLQQNLSKRDAIGEVYSEWLSGQVVAVQGPFIDGTLEKAATFAEELFTWAKPESK